MFKRRSEEIQKMFLHPLNDRLLNMRAVRGFHYFHIYILFNSF